MSRFARPLGRPTLFVVALAYFSLLAVLLVLWHMSPGLVLILTMGGIGLMTIMFRPYWGLHVFVFVLFFELAAALEEGLTAMQGIGVVLFLGWLLSAAVRRKSPIRLDALTILGLLYVAWCAATLPSALDVDVGLTRLISFGQLVVASLMFASVVDDRDKARGIFLAIVSWTFVTTCVALGKYYLGLTPGAVGPVGNRNLLAIYINCATVCAYLLYQTTPQKRGRILLALSLPVFFLGLGLTFSRTGLIVQALVLALVWIRVVRERGFLMLAGSAVTLCLITLLMPTDFYKRVSTIVPTIERQQDTFGVRMRLWNVGIRMIQERPVFGVGPGNFSIGAQRYIHGDIRLVGLSAHNAYVEVAAETGLVGAGLFVGILLAAVAQTRRALRAARSVGAKDMEMFAIMNEIALLALAVHALTGGIEILKYLWLLVGMSFALGRIALSLSEKARPAARAISREHEGAWTLAPGDSQ